MNNFKIYIFVFLFSFFIPSAYSSDFYTDCEKYPNSLSCIPLGEVPSSENVPQNTKEIDIKSGPVFSSISGCPANVVVVVGGQSYTALNMSQACSWISIYMRPLVLLFASISAVFIVLPKD